MTNPLNANGPRQGAARRNYRAQTVPNPIARAAAALDALHASDVREALQILEDLIREEEARHEPIRCPEPGCDFRCQWPGELEIHEWVHAGEERRVA